MTGFSIFVLVLGRVQVEEEAMEWHHWVGVGCCGINRGEMAVFVFQVQVLGSREFLCRSYPCGGARGQGQSDAVSGLGQWWQSRIRDASPSY